MNKFALLFLSFLACSLTFSTLSAQTEDAEFPGVQKAMSPQAFEEAGLSKLTPEERARLDEFIRRYVSTSSEKAVSVAVDRAVKEKKAADPEVIESNIVGVFKGYGDRFRWTLQNGQVWAQSEQVTRIYPPTDSPPVIIVKTGYWHRMYVLGGGNIRVTRIR